MFKIYSLQYVYNTKFTSKIKNRLTMLAYFFYSKLKFQNKKIIVPKKCQTKKNHTVKIIKIIITATVVVEVFIIIIIII